jgi:kynurenine formamidase
LSRIIDLSHTLHSGIIVYPGTQAPEIEEVCAIANEGFSERILKMYSHTGTHLDAPSHIISGGKSLSDLNPQSFCGKAIKFLLNKPNNLSIEYIEAKCKNVGRFDFVLFETGWDKYWNTPGYFNDFPLPQAEVIKYLCCLGIKGIGIDAISVDPVGSIDLPNHHQILSKGMIIIENLTQLNQLPEAVFDFYCFPLKIKNGDGSPVRAVASII